MSNLFFTVGLFVCVIICLSYFSVMGVLFTVCAMAVVTFYKKTPKKVNLSLQVKKLVRSLGISLYK